MTGGPIFNVPTSVTVALACLAGVHAVLWWLPAAEAGWAVLALAFIPARYSGMHPDLPGGEVAGITSLATYQLVHADLTHLLVNGAWLLAFGSAVAARIGPWRFLTFSLLSGVAGALLFLVLRWGELVPVVGASGAVSGLMAATLRFFFAPHQSGHDAWQREPQDVPLASLGETLRNGRMLVVIAIWVGINLAMAVFTPAFIEAGGIAWQVHLGGFAFGLLCFGAFDHRPRSERAIK